MRISQERNSYLHKQLTDALDANKDIWKKMRNLSLLPKRKEENLHGFTPTQLNTHFAGISLSPTENIEDTMEFIKSASKEGFSFHPVNISDVILAISHFSQERGADGVPQEVIVKALPVIGNYLVKIFNTSFAHSIFPSAWKRAQIIALNKNVSPSSVSDFRPIALLCFLSKVLEKVAHDQITKYLKTNSLLDPLQTGFRKNESNHTALFCYVCDVFIKLNSKLIFSLVIF